MINIAMGSFYWCLNQVRTHRNLIRLREKNDEICGAVEVGEIAELLRNLQEHCNDLDFTESSKALRRSIEKFKSPIKWEKVSHELETVLELMESEGGERWIYAIKRNNGETYEAEVDLWVVPRSKFPEASKEAVRGLRCYLINEYTACVFHLMRSAEIGLRALAKERGIILPKQKPIEWGTWQEIIKKVEDEIKIIGATKTPGPGKDTALEFYSGTIGQFYAFKDKYRNQVMHVRANYEKPDADSAIIHVREFITGLSTKLSENSSRRIRWKF